MVLVAAMVVPANAATTILEPINFANGISQTAEGTMLYSFRFKQPPYFECFNGSTLSHQASGSLDWYPAGGFDFYRISISPLGNAVYNATVIDITDFKTGAVLDVTFSALLELNLKSEGSSGLTYLSRSQMLLYWFDKEMNLIKTENCGTVEKSFTHGEVDAWLLQNSYEMQILDDATYVSPRFITQIYKPDAGDIIRVRSDEFIALDVAVEKDDVNAESKLLEAIEKELADLNDKADTIINGTPEMSDKNEQMQGSVSDQKDEMNLVEEAEKEYLQHWEESNNDFKNKILSFLQGKGWVQLSDLLSPFMDFENWIAIMVMVVAFVNLSVIFFGR